MVKARRILQVWSNVEGMVARSVRFGESSLTLKPSCILPRTFCQGSAPAQCHLLSILFLPSYSPYHLPASSFSLCFSFLSLSFVSLSPLLARLFQYPIFIIRFQLIVSLIVWHRTRSILFISSFHSCFVFLFFFLFLYYTIIFRMFRVLLFYLVFGYFKLLNFK